MYYDSSLVITEEFNEQLVERDSLLVIWHAESDQDNSIELYNQPQNRIGLNRDNFDFYLPDLQIYFNEIGEEIYINSKHIVRGFRNIINEIESQNYRYLNPVNTELHESDWEEQQKFEDNSDIDLNTETKEDTSNVSVDFSGNNI